MQPHRPERRCSHTAPRGYAATPPRKAMQPHRPEGGLCVCESGRLGVWASACLRACVSESASAVRCSPERA
eukprot:11716296-Alexandrium_andersonii.AAC.1